MKHKNEEIFRNLHLNDEIIHKINHLNSFAAGSSLVQESNSLHIDQDEEIKQEVRQ
jgi:hypothetical protein